MKDVSTLGLNWRPWLGKDLVQNLRNQNRAEATDEKYRGSQNFQIPDVITTEVYAFHVYSMPPGLGVGLSENSYYSVGMSQISLLNSVIDNLISIFTKFLVHFGDCISH